MCVRACEGAATQACLFLTHVNFDMRQKHLPLFSIRVATQEAFMKLFFSQNISTDIFDKRHQI